MTRIRLWVVVILLVSFTGCLRAPKIKKKAGPGGDSASDPLKEAAEALNRGSNYREVVNSLNAYLEKNPEVKAKLKLDDDTRKLLLDRFDLTADQLAEIADGQFRSLDAAYLEECWLLRQAAFSQGMQGLNTLQRARR